MSITIKRYYNSTKDFFQFYKILKQLACPHCGLIGALILNGKLKGYDENEDKGKVVRGRRVYCNKRKKHSKGCGRTFSLLAVNVLKNFRISAKSFWCFLKNIVKLTSKIDAYRKEEFPLGSSSVYRLWNRFLKSQSHIRNLLTKRCQAPQNSTTLNPAIQTIEHIEKAFSSSSCPIEDFQYSFQTSFV